MTSYGLLVVQSALLVAATVAGLLGDGGQIDVHLFQDTSRRSVSTPTTSNLIDPTTANAD